MSEAAVETNSDKSLVRPNEIANRRRHYEVTYLITPTTNDADAKEIAEKNISTIQTLKGTILRSDDWGKRKLPHILEKHQMARYHYFRIVSTSACLKEFERNLKLDARIIRFLSVRLSDILTDAQIADLVERAPREVSNFPSVHQEEEDLESQGYSAQ